MLEKEEEGCAGKSVGAPAVVKSPGDPLVEFRYPDNPTFDLVYLAEALGYFEGSRTRPKYVGKIAAPQIIPLVGIGEIDFGTRMVPLVISAIASGLDIKVVSAGGKTLEEAPHMKYFVRRTRASVRRRISKARRGAPTASAPAPGSSPRWELASSGLLFRHLEASLYRSLADPLLQLFRQTSALALFPVFILFFGIGELSRMAIICWASFWPILLSLSPAWERGEIHACRYPGRPRKVSPSMVKMLQAHGRATRLSRAAISRPGWS